jgi:DNA-binding transcriptional ArsR family regulator
MSGPFDRGTGPNPWSTLFGPGSSGFGRSNVRWRIFDRGDLKYMILELLRERPMHGYEVMRALEKTSQGCYSASPGSVYPALQSLEDDGYVSGVEEDGRKVYTVEDILHRLGDFARHFSGAPMTDVTKSFVRLAHASFEQTVRRVGDEESLERMREILERAAREIEGVGRASRKPRAEAEEE